MVFSFDEKPQVQALQRAQPILPMDLGQPERQTHNYLRHGTLDLFAALNVATGEVLTRCTPQHRAQDFVAFLRDIDASVETGLAIHVVLDNLSAHAILAYVEPHNERRTPFKWVKTAHEILNKMRLFGFRAQQVYNQRRDFNRTAADNGTRNCAVDASLRSSSNDSSGVKVIAASRSNSLRVVGSRPRTRLGTVHQASERRTFGTVEGREIADQAPSESDLTFLVGRCTLERRTLQLAVPQTLPRVAGQQEATLGDMRIRLSNLELITQL